jgi:hypothetical protein
MRVMSSTQEQRAMEARESDDSEGLEQRNKQLGEHIEEAERAVEHRRGVVGETPAGDLDDLDDTAGGEDPSGAVDES